MDIAEVRSKFPQYGDLSDVQLADAMHKKFYADMDKSEFYKKVGLPASADVPGSDPNFRKKPREEPSITQRIDAAGEAIPGLVAGVVGGTAGAIAGGIRALPGFAGGKYGTQEGIQQGVDLQNKVAGTIAKPFQPQSDLGKEYLQNIGEFLGGTVGALGPEALAIAPRIAGPAAAASQESKAAVAGISKRIAELQQQKQPQMVGMGAATTDVGALRQARADALPVPIKLTKGQRERTFEQQQFERETAKDSAAGAPLRERYAEQNQQVLQNFDAWVDQTGAEAGGLRAVGQIVNDAVVAKSRKAKSDIRAAYDRATKAGDMAENIPTKPLTEFLAEHEPEAINAPVLTSAAAKLEKLSKDGQISIGALEEVRKMVGNLGGKDATNALFSSRVKAVIDGMTDGKGGDAYKQARALRARYAREFEDVGVINRLMSTKPGSSDRAVAYEDVFAHSILKGSLDDVRAVRKTLQTAGPQGTQAWRELQGQTVRHLKDEITKNVQIDQKGNTVVSPAKLNALVSELDKDGKLDFIFGKQGAQQIREVNEISKDIFTAPPGSVNHSNTTSALLNILDLTITAASGLHGIPVPVPVASAAAHGIRKIKQRVLNKRVSEALQ